MSAKVALWSSKEEPITLKVRRAKRVAGRLGGDGGSLTYIIFIHLVAKAP